MLQTRKPRSRPVFLVIILFTFTFICYTIVKWSKSFVDIQNGVIRLQRDWSGQRKYLLLVQGKSQTLESWVRQHLTVDDFVSLIYLCYDQEILPLRRERLLAFSRTNTTWTEGRNILGQEAFRFEQETGEEFHYWIFSDEDLKLQCQTGLCWLELFDLLDKVSNPVVAIQFPSHMEPRCKRKDAVFLTDSYDAMLNCFNRRHISTLMPYVSFGDNVSWWISQAIHFKLMRVCYPLSALVPCSIVSVNEGHSEYPRGRDQALELRLFKDSYGQFGDLEKLMEGVNIPQEQLVFTEGPFTLAEVSPKIFDNKCQGFEKRFSSWISNEKVY